MTSRSFLSRWRWLGCWLLMCGPVVSADWPAYRHDVRRSAATPEKPALPLAPAWTYTCAQPPAPAWPEQLEMANWMDFDYAPAIVVADGLLCFGSSADDSVRALDARTGVEKWRFTAGGPVRLAPQIAKGKVYFGSDDGWIYCLDASSGRPLWTFRVALGPELMIINERMVSRWPARSGVLVDEGVVYCVGGMLNTEGVYAFALDADTGQVIWCNDTCNYSKVAFQDFLQLEQVNEGHQGEMAFSGSTPQGPLALGDRALVIPNGNVFPTVLDRRTGQLIAWDPYGFRKTAGGTWTAVDGDDLHLFTQWKGACSIISYSLSTGAMGKWFEKNLFPQFSIAPPQPRSPPAQLHTDGQVRAVVSGGQRYVRLAYGLALAGDVLLRGEDGAVVAERAGRTPSPELWRAEVIGEARDLAVADGRLYVSTSRGAIHCFGPTGGRPAAAPPKPEAGPPPIAAPESTVVEQLRQAGVDRGYALVLGDADGRLSEAMARQTRLHVICALPASAVDGVRARLIDTTTLYGTRIHVQAIDRAGRLPFPQWFANAVVVAGPTPGLAGRDLYRVLRPCGGVLLAPGLKPAEAEALARDTGAAADELRRDHGSWRVVRGKLAGALDWDADPKAPSTDRCVRWPLRTQWIGGPSTRQIRNYRQGAAGPVVGGGRYVIGGERTLTGVDAYNGAVLWSRPVPQTCADLRMVDGLIYAAAETNVFSKGDFARRLRLNDEFVYLTLGKAFFRGTGEASIKIDARTGEQVAFYGPFNPPAPILLTTRQTWAIPVDTAHSGTVTLGQADRGLVLTLTTKDPAPTPADSWDLCFDFRPPASRYGLYERGAFHVVVTVARTNAAPRWSPGSGPAHPRIEVSGECESGGTRIEVLVPWAELEALAGAKPSSFAFAVALNSHDGGRNEPIVRRHLFGDWTADTINNGWAAVALDERATANSASAPSILAGPISALKEPAGAARGGRAIDESVSGAPRAHPLTGELEPKVYRAPTMCGMPYFADVLLSGRAGVYDFSDDSGMRFVGGVKSRCTSPQVIANGLLLISEETGHCTCNYPFRTSVALAPAAERQNEDWAIYHDREADTRVRQAFINLGAPGDRRDPDGHLWLGFPRPPATGMNYSIAATSRTAAATANGVWMRFLPSVFQVPLEIESFGGPDAYRPEEDTKVDRESQIEWVPNRRQTAFGPVRKSADRVVIRGTDRPWIYASQYRGIRKATLKMDFIKPLTAAACARAPVIDGAVSESTWAGEPTAGLPFTRTFIRVRYDADGLYIAAQRPPVINRRGEIAPWAATTRGEDAPVWSDDSFEVFLGDAANVLHFGVSASGASYDARATGTNTEDEAWDARWTRAARGGTNGLAFELAIPWKTLTGAGLSRNALGLNVQMNQMDISGEELTYRGGHDRSFETRETSGEAFFHLGYQGRTHCTQFAPLGIGGPPNVQPGAFTVRLHFAEIDDVPPGQRVFDVKLQGQIVLTNFDVLAEAGAARTALAREFKGVKAGEALTLEFVPRTKELDAGSAPILSALELSEDRSSASSGPDRSR